MKRYPKSNPVDPITVGRISGVDMLDPIALMPGETRWLRVSITRLKDDPEVVAWSSAHPIEAEVIEVEW